MMKIEKILVVDDILTMRKFVGRLLRDKYEVIYASNGAEALEKSVNDHPPDLILLDVLMPDISGYEVCRRLKKNPNTIDIPVIFLSGQDDTVDKLKGLNIGGVDYITKPFDPAELLARVATHLQVARMNRELAAMNRELAERQQRMDLELQTAAEIQRYLLPDETPRIAGLEFAWEFLPSATLGGDIFNVVYLDQRHIGIYIIDVSGHGVPSALVTFAVAQSLNPQGGIVLSEGGNSGASPPGIVPPADVLTTLDRIFPVDRFNKTFTIIYLVYDLETGTLTYANAGHPAAVLINEKSEIKRLETGGPLIGLDGMAPFDQEQVCLEQGDRLILFTDGVLEYQNENRSLFGEDRLIQVIKKANHLPLSAVIYALSWSLIEFGGRHPPQDDVTILAMSCGEKCCLQ